MDVIDTRVPFRHWSRLVKELYDNKCAICGSVEKLESHHIKPRSLAPDEYNDLANGICLCHKCHFLVHGGAYYTSDKLSRVNRPTIPHGMEDRYQAVKDYMDTCINIVFPAELRLNELLDLAASKLGVSKDEFICEAITSKLHADGITIDSLPASNLAHD